MTALIRNLATMTRVGVLAPGSAGTAQSSRSSATRERLRKARVHPIAVLAALRTYAAGHGARGGTRGARCARSSTRSTRRSTRLSTTSSRPASAAAGARRVRLDGLGPVAGVPGLTPRVASAAMALVTAATEPRPRDRRLLRRDGRLRRAADSRAASGSDAAGDQPAPAARRRGPAVSDLPFGGTDCALPMLWAQAQEREVDMFVVYTDTRPGPGGAPGAGAARVPRETGIAAG